LVKRASSTSRATNSLRRSSAAKPSVRSAIAASDPALGLEHGAELAELVDDERPRRSAELAAEPLQTSRSSGALRGELWPAIVCASLIAASACASDAIALPTVAQALR
jgi:hypothetical protein